LLAVGLRPLPISVDNYFVDRAHTPRDENGDYNGSKYTSTIANPIAQIDNTNNEATATNIIGNVYAEFDIVKGLKFKSDYGITHGYDRYWEFSPTFFVKVGDENAVNSLYESYSVGGTQNWTNYFTYNNTFAEDHTLSLMAGNELYQENYKFMGASGTDLVSNNPDLATFDNLRNGQAIPSGSYYQSRRVSYMARVSYSYKNKYLAQINYRVDGSSKFAEAHRYGQFPSFSLGWKMSEEPFLQNVAFLSNLKLRAGWGKIGNDRITPFAFYSVSQGGCDYVINNENVGGTSFPLPINEDIRWESTVTTNIAVDAAFFDDRLTFVLDLYNKKTSDMLIQAVLPGAVGAEEYPWTNQGSMDNKGFEVELGYKEVFGDWKVGVSGNFAYNKNEVTDLGMADYIASAPFQGMGFVSRTEVGRPVASFYGYQAVGLFQNQAEIDAYVKPDGQPIQRGAKPGDIKYLADADGNLVMDFIGSPLPDFTYGFNLNVEYRGFDFTMFLQGVYGNEVFNTTKFYTNNPSARYNLSADMVDRWMAEGSTNDPNLPRMDVNDQQNAKISDRFVEDGSYLRVKNLQLGYTLPENLLSTLKIQNLRVFVGVSNLFTFTKYTGLDPEVGVGISDDTGERDPLDLGIDRVKYPQPRTYMAGISLTF
jgi:TonB-linked SusC/RagA family outer membrane protein